MSLYDKASLALIPSGTKASTLYSVLPANGNGDFTHTRGSTATRVNKDGLIESVASNVPRLDYPLIDGVVQDCPTLLLEPSRTNLATYSEDFYLWSSGSTYVTRDQAISPDGNLTSDLFAKTTSFQNIQKTATVVSGSDYSFSIFVKANTISGITLRLASGSYDVRKYLNLEDLSVSNAGGNQTGFIGSKVEEYPNDWYRYTITATSNATTQYLNVYVGNGTVAESGSIYIWGAQFELGDYPTSYIPTTSSTVTRNADECNGAGTSAEFNDSEGVLFVEFAALDNDLTHRRIAISDGTTSNLVYVSFDTTSNRILANANGRIMIYVTEDETQFQKVAVYYNATAPKLYVNGFLRETETAMTAITGLSELAFDNGIGSNDFYGKTKQLMTFNEALTDSELEQVTSWTSFGEMAKGQLYTIE